MGGVSGAFLLLPFQVSFLGYTAPSVSATYQLFNIEAIFKLPVYIVAVAALMGTFLTSVVGLATFYVMSMLYPEMNLRPDWLLGLLFGVGGLLGIYAGARCQKYVPAFLIKLLLGACILLVAGKYIVGFFL